MVTKQCILRCKCGNLYEKNKTNNRKKKINIGFFLSDRYLLGYTYRNIFMYTYDQSPKPNIVITKGNQVRPVVLSAREHKSVQICCLCFLRQTSVSCILRALNDDWVVKLRSKETLVGLLAWLTSNYQVPAKVRSKLWKLSFLGRKFPPSPPQNGDEALRTGFIYLHVLFDTFCLLGSKLIMRTWS